jgi:FkbM family methyltransferase
MSVTLGFLLYSDPVFRRILQNLSSGVVLKRHLPQHFGGVPLFVSPESALAYWRRDLSRVDPFLLSMVRELVRPRMTVWDIGANVGLFSFAAAALGAQVLAVEADTWLANLIHRSALLNKLPVTVLPAAMSDHQGISRLYLSKEGKASNSRCGNGIAQTVVALTLDSLLDHFAAPQVLKIDVEGMEYAVLSGARRVLTLDPSFFAKSQTITRQSVDCCSLLVLSLALRTFCLSLLSRISSAVCGRCEAKFTGSPA